MIRLVYTIEALSQALRQVRSGGRAPGIDGVAPKQFPHSALAPLRRSILGGAYEALPARRVYLPKSDGRLRPIGILCVKDRIAQRCLLDALTDGAERKLTDSCWAFRPGRSIRHAVTRVRSWREIDGFSFVARFDIAQCYESIDRRRLLDLLKRLIEDERILDMIRLWLESGWIERGALMQDDEGVPQGDPLSPLWCNLYLDALDRAMIRRYPAYLRYADDCVAACKTARQAEKAIELADAELAKNGMRLNQTKSGTGSFDQGFRFLGAYFVGGLAVPCMRQVDPDGRERRTFGYDGPCELALKAAAGRLKALDDLPDLIDPKVSKRLIEALTDSDWSRPTTAMAKAFLDAWKETAEKDEEPTEEARPVSCYWI